MITDVQVYIARGTVNELKSVKMYKQQTQCYVFTGFILKKLNNFLKLFFTITKHNFASELTLS